MMELIRITFFRDWNRRQVIDFTLSALLAMAAFATTLALVILVS